MRWNDWLSILAFVISVVTFMFRWKQFTNAFNKVFRKTSGFPDKKDLTYWLLILLIIISVISTWRTDEPGILADQLSLGGTLLSILLAVVAIVFSFVQSSETSKQNLKMIEEIQKHSQIIGSLDNVAEGMRRRNEQGIEKMRFVEKFMKESFDKLYDHIKHLAESNLKSGNDEMSEKIKSTLNELDEIKSDTSFLNSSISVIGPNSLLNTIRKYIQPGGGMHIQVLWNHLQEVGISISLEELKSLLLKLENTGDIKTVESGSHFIFKLLPKE